MRAIILAAGYGRRLGQDAPKCLLPVGGKTLLERHLLLLKQVGVTEVVLVVGYAWEQIAAELERLDWSPRPTLVRNPEYTLGSVLSVHCAAPALTAGGDVLLMDADVLYGVGMLQLLTADAHADRLLQDRGFTPGDEPVKLCSLRGAPVELRKKVTEGLEYDAVGESVGFFRFKQESALRLANIVQDYIDGDRAAQPHEEAVRDLLLERPHRFHVADATGLPWLEIDFPADVVRAREEILPRLETL